MVGQYVSFLVSPGESRERRVGEVTAMDGDTLTIAAEGGPFERPASECIGAAAPVVAEPE